MCSAVLPGERLASPCHGRLPDLAEIAVPVEASKRAFCAACPWWIKVSLPESPSCCQAQASRLKISLLAIDIDGTLVAQGDRVPVAARQAVRRAVEHGLAVVLATGRRYRTTRLAIDQLQLPLAAVCLGGALTKGAHGETLHCEAFTTQQIATLLTLSREQDLALVLHRDSHARGGADFVADSGAPWNAHTRRYMAAGGRAGVAGGAAATDYDDILMAGCFGERAPLANLQRRVDAVGEFATVLVESQKTPGWYLETIRRHVNKWTALRRFAAAADIAETAICAVGDALNDLQMIRNAAFGVAMGNADPAVKAAADWTTGSNRADGLALLIDRLIEEC